MATELIATGSGAANSADITVVDGATATVFLKDADGGGFAYKALVHIEIKDSAGTYNWVGKLTDGDPCKVIAGKGTYRLRRDAESGVVGAGQG